MGRSVSGSVILVVVGVSCAPVVVLTSDGAGPAQIELDEAEVRCARREGCACYALGAFHAQRGEPSRQLLVRSCSLGCAQGCADLSDTYFDGLHGERRDAALGLRYGYRACQLDAVWCDDVGERYEVGIGVKRDDARARSLYREGCNRRSASSCSGLERLTEASPPSPPAPSNRPP